MCIRDRLYPFVLLFFYQLYYFSAGLFAPHGDMEAGAWALRRGKVLLGLYALCGLAGLALYLLCGAPGTEGPAALAMQFVFGLGTAPFGSGLLWLLPSTFLTEFLFVLLRRIFPGRWFLLFACGLVSLGASMVYGLSLIHIFFRFGKCSAEEGAAKATASEPGRV